MLGRAIFQRMFLRPLRCRKSAPIRTRPPALGRGLLRLEDRITPNAVDVGGLRFNSPATFTVTATTYSTTADIDVGLIPTGSAAFKPLLKLFNGGGVITRTPGSESLQSKGTIQAITTGSGPAIGDGTVSIPNLLSSTGAALASANSFPAVGEKFTANNLRIALPAGSTDTTQSFLAMRGTMVLPALGLNTISISGSNQIVTGAGAAEPQLQAAANLPFQASFTLGGLRIAGSVAASYSVSGNTFAISGNAQLTLPGSNDAAIALGSTASPGLVVADGALSRLDFSVTAEARIGGVFFTSKGLGGSYSPATSTYALRGGATFALAGNTVGVNFGSEGTAGVVIVAGTLTEAAFAVDSQIKLGGLQLNTSDLKASYAVASNQFTLTGPANFALAGNTVNVDFVPGLVVANGSLVSLGFKTSADLKLGGVSFTSSGLAFGFDQPAGIYTMKGAAQFALKGNAVDVNFGDDGTAGLVIANGAVSNAAFAINSELKIGGLQLKATDLKASYADASKTFTLAGPASFTLSGNSVTADFTPGLVITNGSLASIGFAVTSDVKVGGVTFSANGLGFTYDDPSSTYTMKGGAKFALKGNTVDVKFGEDGTQGLVVSNGALVAAAFAINSEIKIGGLQLKTTDLKASYTDASKTFTLTGPASLTVGGNAVNVNFSPGLMVTNGNLVSLGFAVATELKLGGLAFAANGLAFTYDDPSATYTMKGGAKLSLKGNSVDVNFGDGGTPGLVLVNGSLTSVAFAVNSEMKIGGLQLKTTDLKATYTDATKTFTLAGAGGIVLGGNSVAVNFSPGLVLVNGAVSGIGFAVTTELKLGGVTFTANGLGFTYDDPSSTYTMKGGAKFALKSNNLDVNFGEDGTRGLVVANGAITDAAFTVNSEMKIAGLQLKTTDLKSTYTDATKTFTLAGAASLNLRSNTIAIALGADGSAGFVITNGALQTIDASVTSNFSFSKVEFGTRALRFQYDAATASTPERFRLSGDAFAKFSAAGSPVNLEVKFGGTFGSETVPGLLIENGDLKELAIGVTADFKLVGLQVGIAGLTVAYKTDRNEFDLYGGVKLSTATQGGKRVLDNFAVSMGDRAAGVPGIRIVDGTLEKLDVTLNGTINLGSLNVTPDHLRVVYTRATSLLQFTGGLQASLASRINAKVVLTNGGLTINTSSGAVNLQGLHLSLADTSFGPVTIRHAYIDYAQNMSGSFDLAGGAEVELPAGITVTGSFGIVNGKLRSIALQFEKDPGIPVFQGIVYLRKLGGSVTNLDDLNNISVSGTLELTGGPSMRLRGTSYALIRASGSFTANADYLTLSGNVKVFEGLVAEGSGDIRINFGSVARDVIVPETREYAYDRSALFAYPTLRSKQIEDAIIATKRLEGKVTVLSGSVYPAIGYEADVALVKSTLIAIGKANLYPSFLSYFHPRTDQLIETFRQALVQTYQQNAAARYRGDLNDPDPNADPAVRALLKPGELIETRVETETLQNGSGTLRQTKVYFIVKPEHTIAVAADLSLPKVAANFTASMYGGFVKLRFNFRLEANGDVWLRAMGGAYIPDAVPVIGGDPLGEAEIVVAIRPNSPLSQSFAQFTARKVLGIVNELTLKATFTGTVSGLVDIKFIPTFDFGPSNLFANLGSGNSLQRLLFDNGAGTSAHDIAADDPRLTEAPPTVHVLSFVPIPGTPDGRLTYLATSAHPDRSSVDLFVDTLDGGYQGVELLANLPVGVGPQTVTIPNIARFAMQPYSPNQTIYAYAVIEDGTHLPGFSVYSDAVTPPNYDPSLSIPALAAFAFDTPIAFSARTHNRILVVDPLAASNPDSTVELRLRVQSGTLTLGSDPGKVEVVGSGTDEIVLVGTAARINAALDELTYTPMAGTVFDDEMLLQLGRIGEEGVGVIEAKMPLRVQMVSIHAPNAIVSPDGSPQTVLAALTLADSESDWIAGATVRIDGYLPGGDLLSFPGHIDIASSWDPTTGTLTLLGIAPLDDYQAALRTITLRMTGLPQTKTLIVTVADAAGSVGETTISLATRDQSPGLIAGARGARLDPTAGPGSIAIDPGISVTDADGSTLTRATVAVAGGYLVGQDSLTFAAQIGLPGQFNPATGTLTFTGTASLAAYTALLRSVRYVNSAHTPTPGPRTLIVTVDDGTPDNATATAYERVFVTALPLEAPTLTGTTPNQTLAADATSLAIAPAILLASTNGANLLGATIRLSNGNVPGEDALTVDALPNGVTALFDGLSGTLSLSGIASVADYELALRSVRYVNLAGARTTTARRVEFAIDDGFARSTPAVVNVAVVAPPIVIVGLPPAVATQGRTAVTISPNLLVAATGQLVGATVAFLDAYDMNEDRLVYTALNGITGTFDRLAGVLTLTGSATAAQYELALRTVAYLNLRANPSAHLREVGYIVTDGTYVSNSALGKTSIDVEPVGVAPIVNISTEPLRVPERSGAAVIAPNLSVADPDAGLAAATSQIVPNLTGQRLLGATVEITGNYVRGEDELTFTPFGGITGRFDADNGELILAGDGTLAEYRAVLASVRYRNISPGPSTAPRTITYTLAAEHGATSTAVATVIPLSNDDGPTQSGGLIRALSVYAGASVTSLGLGDLWFTPPAGFTDLAYTVTAIPDCGAGILTLADGTVPVVDERYSLEQLRRAKFQPGLINRTERFAFRVAGLNPITGLADASVFAVSVPIHIVSKPITPGQFAVGAGVGSSPIAQVFNADGSLQFQVMAYNAAFLGGVRVAVGDVNDDGVPDLMTAPGPGGGPHVRVFDGLTRQPITEFLAYSPQFLGGVTVAAADVNGDGRADIITGAGAGGGPHVQAFDALTGERLASFYAYSPRFLGGVNVGGGDVNGDGRADIITGAGAGGGPHVQAFDVMTGERLASFYAYDPNFTGGVNVSAGDIAGDGRAEILTGPGPGRGPQVRAYTLDAQLVRAFAAFNSPLLGGVLLATVDLNHDGKDEIVAGVEDWNQPTAWVYDGVNVGVLLRIGPPPRLRLRF